MMVINYGKFVATLNREHTVASIDWEEPGKHCNLMTHTCLIDPGELHDFDRFAAITWPHMNAHDRSDICCLMRLLVEEGIRMRAAYLAGTPIVDADAPEMIF